MAVTLSSSQIFWLKKILTYLFYPTSFIWLLCAFLAILCFFKRWRVFAVLNLLCLWVLFGLITYGVFTPFTLARLEQEFKPLKPEDVFQADYVVVLGGGIRVDSRYPVTSQILDTALIRVVEGVRFWHMNPSLKLIFSGSYFGRSQSEARVMAELATQLGVSPERIILEEASTDTEAHPDHIKEIVGDKKFILVTSAFHMKRACALFRKKNLNFLPAPADFMEVGDETTEARHYFPNVRNLWMLEVWMKETLGYWWSLIRGNI